MINLQQISLTLGQKLLFDEVSLTFHDKQKFGLVGKNGTGKSSLLGLLLHRLEPTSGAISFQGNLRFSYVEQEVEAINASAIEYVIAADREYSQLQDKILEAEENKKFEKLAELHAELAMIDGYSIHSRAASLLSGLGFTEEMQQYPIKSFSGGWRMRLNLARALLCPSDVLLLDEPTNHLDLETIIWLEKWLQNYSGLLIIISHDRDFLDKIVDHIAFIDQKQIQLYRGNYSTYERERAEQLALQQTMYEKQQKQIKHMMKFVERFRYKATKAKQAQSRLKSIDKIEQVAAVQSSTPFNFEFATPDECPYPIITLDHLTLGYNQPVLSNVNWQLIPGDRIALLGPNGAGKSTLMKALSGKLAPLSGKITLDRKVSIGYFAQHQLEALKLHQSPMEHLIRLSPQSSQQELRNYLGGFGFNGDAALQPIENFSGGEKSRLALAILVRQKPNLLLLDEPTNHLDMEMRNALMLALQSFEGALVLISHDRFLIRNTVDQLWLIANHKVQRFSGDLDDYKTWVNQQAQVKKEDASPKTKQVNAKQTQQKKPNPVKVAALEKEITKLETQLTELNHSLSDTSLYDDDDDKNKAKRELLFEKQKAIQERLLQLENEWLKYHG